jgi:hypothetical protein
MRIDCNAALTLAALIRSSLAAIDRLETHVSQLDIEDLSLAELDSLGYSLHNIYNALENCFEQISLSFENNVRDRTRWHRELLEKMFLDINPLRPAVYQINCAPSSRICSAFGTYFDTPMNSNLTKLRP